MGKAIFTDYKPGEPRIIPWNASVHIGRAPGIARPAETAEVLRDDVALAAPISLEEVRVPSPLAVERVAQTSRLRRAHDWLLRG